MRVIALVILIAAGASRLAASQSTSSLGASGNADEYAEDIDITVASLDKFWTREFAAMNTPYQKPSGLFWYDINDQAHLGACSPTQVTALYCRLDDAIYWEELHLMRPWHQEIGDFAPAFVIAHEWGHAIQQRMGVLADTGLYTIEKELQADCFAGAWASYAENDEGILEDGDVDEALAGLLLVRDPVGMPWLDPTAHGTGSQRIQAFHMGYNDGRTRCSDPMPLPRKVRTR